MPRTELCGLKDKQGQMIRLYNRSRLLELEHFVEQKNILELALHDTTTAPQEQVVSMILYRYVVLKLAGKLRGSITTGAGFVLDIHNVYSHGMIILDRDSQRLIIVKQHGYFIFKDWVYSAELATWLAQWLEGELQPQEK